MLKYKIKLRHVSDQPKGAAILMQAGYMAGCIALVHPFISNFPVSSDTPLNLGGLFDWAVTQLNEVDWLVKDEILWVYIDQNRGVNYLDLQHRDVHHTVPVTWPRLSPGSLQAFGRAHPQYFGTVLRAITEFEPC